MHIAGDARADAVDMRMVTCDVTHHWAYSRKRKAIFSNCASFVEAHDFASTDHSNSVYLLSDHLRGLGYLKQ